MSMCITQRRTRTLVQPHFGYAATPMSCRTAIIYMIPIYIYASGRMRLCTGFMLLIEATNSQSPIRRKAITQLRLRRAYVFWPFVCEWFCLRRICYSLSFGRFFVRISSIQYHFVRFPTVQGRLQQTKSIFDVCFFYSFLSAFGCEYQNIWWRLNVSI